MANFALPYLIYVAASPRWGDVHALMASSLPPIGWSVATFAVKRKLDALSLLVIGGIVLSLLAFVGGGSARFLQLRENLVTGLIGLIFLGSAAVGKPLIYQLALASASRKSAAAATELASLRERRGFRDTMLLMTLVWGFGLVLETAAACVLVYTIPVARYLLVSPVLGYGTMAALGLWTFWYAKRAKRRGEVARLAAGAQPPLA